MNICEAAKKALEEDKCMKSRANYQELFQH